MDPNFLVSTHKEIQLMLAKAILVEAGYDKFGGELRENQCINFTTCGQDTEMKLDLCLWHPTTSMVLLVVQIDKTLGSDGDTSTPKFEVIANAIAIYDHNNKQRLRHSLPSLEVATIPCITIHGTRPQFYKVPVTRELSDAVKRGGYSEQETVVKWCAPPPCDSHLEDLRIALQHYHAFGTFVKEFCSKTVTGVF